MKSELGEKVITKFVGLRAKIDCCLIEDGSKEKKQKAKKTVL